MPTAIYARLKGRSSGRASAGVKPKIAREVKKKKPEEREKKQPGTTPTTLPKTATYPRSWKEVRKAGISFAAAGIHTIIPAEPGIRFSIIMITFTVGGATDITFYDGGFPFSGPMDFGGADEPRGIVIPTGDSPMMLGKESAFRIGSTGTFQVSGFVAYMAEIVEPPPETPP